MFLCFDTETTGLPSRSHASYRDTQAYDTCRMISIAWYLLDDSLQKVHKRYFVLRPDFEDAYWSPEAENIHKISFAFAHENGVSFDEMLTHLHHDLDNVTTLVGHNVAFDVYVLKHELHRRGKQNVLDMLREKKICCTMKFACQKLGWARYPKLVELYRFLFGMPLENAHHALADVRACAYCFVALAQK